MKKSRTWLFWFLSISSTISVGCYSSVLISPTVFWPAAMISYLIPFVIIWNLIILLPVVFIRKKYALFPLAMLILGYPFFKVTYQSNPSPSETSEGLQVQSFNAKFFRKKGVYNAFSTDLIQWAANDPADIKCFQEYSTNARWEPLDVTRQISNNGYMGFIFNAEIDGNDHSPGMAIFSKYPIVGTGFVWKDPQSIYAGIFIDIRYQQDTLRIYNVHLTSLQLVTSPEEEGTYKKKVFKKFKHAVQSRTEQVNKLLQHLESSPYPSIVCGDFNNVPYSYNYFRLKRYLRNSFEDAGNGFGFTYNHRFSFFRIDHQFYSNNIKPISFSVDTRMDISDHYPTRGTYLFTDN